MKSLEEIKKENKEADKVTKEKTPTPQIEMYDGLKITREPLGMSVTIEYKGKKAMITATILRLLLLRALRGDNLFDFMYTEPEPEEN